MPTVLLQFPSKSLYVGVARLAVAGIARAAGFDEESVFDLKIAVSEALSTGVLSDAASGKEAPIVLSWDDTPDSVVIEVSHAGGLQAASGDDPGGDRQDMSTALLRSLLDECEFISEADGATTIRLTLRR